jgi:nitroreductase
MVENFEAIPAIIFPCLVKPEEATGPPQYSSIFPAVQNLLLAARGLGLGAVITAGIAMPYINEVKELLHTPLNVEPVALIPIGWPDKERYGKTTRKPVEEISHWEAWGKRLPAERARV